MRKNNVPQSIWKNPVHFLAFGFGAGAAPYAPGTFGTLAAVPIYLLLVQTVPWVIYLLIAAVMFIVGVWVCEITERNIGVHDHPGIVWDEIVGYLVTMLFAPVGWLWIVIGFFLFRLFDIWKPFPIRQLERRYGGGFGNMVDDLLAGVYANITLQGIALLAYRARLIS